MKKLILTLSIVGLFMGCYINLAHSKHASGKGSMGITVINTTTGQELVDLKEALDSEAITQEEYDELKLEIIDERHNASADSTVQEIMEMIFESEVAPADSTDTN